MEGKGEWIRMESGREDRMNGIEGIKESSMNKNGRWNEMENESEQKSVE